MKKNRTVAVILIVAIFVFTGAAPTVFAYQENWTEDIRLTYTYGRSVAPAFAVEGENIHIVFIDNETGGKYQMFPWYVRSIDGGYTWSTPICLNNSSQTDIGETRIAVRGVNIHVIWFESSDGKIRYLKSTDNGNSWNSEKIISSTVYNLNSNLDIEVYESNLHVTYMNSDKKLSYVNSIDEGDNWSSPKILMPTINQISGSALSVEGSNIHITVSANIVIMGILTSNIFYTKSVDNGVNWDTEVNINEVTGITNLSGSPDIEASGDKLHVIFRGAGYANDRVYYASSNDNGKNWENRGMLSTTTKYAVYPTIDVKDNVIFIIWTYKGVHYRYSKDGGESWIEEAIVTNSSGSSPDLAISEDAVHLAWCNHLDWEIYYKRYSLVPQTINGGVDIDPDTLNLKSKGKWITAYIEFPEGFDVNDINISSIMLQNTIPAELHPSKVGDHDNDSIPDLMVKFDRSSVEDIASPGEIVLTLIGLLTNGTSFEGNDTIMVIFPS